MMKLYEVKSGTSVKQLKVPTNIAFIDEKNIRTDFYKYAALACAYKFMQTKNNMFNPAGTVTRAEMVLAMKRVLEKLGEI